MKVVILAGGLGTRLSEETTVRPKPMVEIGSRPLLWHIMKIYSHFGCDDFIICLGYKGFLIKEYFANYWLRMSDVTVDVAKNQLEIHQRSGEPWRVTLIDTGDATQTGGRLKRALPYVADEKEFALTYGDGVADIDVRALREFHLKHGKLATVTAVQPIGRFGAMLLDGDKVASFQEKPDGDGGWVNGGFFILSPKIGRLLADDQTVWEREPLETLARSGELRAYHHRGFWQAMDTLRDKTLLEDLWAAGKAPWKLW